MNRRTFIETSVAAGVLSALPSRAFPATNQIEKVGVQLYTVRDAMKSDFTGTIAKVASIGYKEMEFAGYFNHSPSEVRAILDTKQYETGIEVTKSQMQQLHISRPTTYPQWNYTLSPRTRTHRNQ